MSDKNKDLPGFYRDPKTGKYYREKPGGACNPSIKKLKKEREEEEWQNMKISRCPKISNVCKLLRAKELGQMSGLNAELEYLKMKTHKKCLIEETCLPSSEDTGSVAYLKGTKDSVFVVYDISDAIYRCVIGELAVSSTPTDRNFSFKISTNYIIDVCEGPDSAIVCLYNNPLSGVGCFAMFPQDSIHIIDDAIRWNCKSRSPIFCCSTATQGLSFALGCVGLIKFYERFSNVSTYSIGGRVHAISFDESSNIMVSGLHNGQMCVHDIRAKKFVKNFQVATTSINDSYYLDPHQIIVAGPENLLCRVDLRMDKVVTHYYGHKTSMKKRPFSVANNMLCATGADQVVRIWHLSGGSPIDEMKPFFNPENETRAWMYGNSNKTYLFHVEKKYRKRFEIF